MTAIFKKEFRGYFYNMSGYIFIALTLALVGIYFNDRCLSRGIPYFEQVISACLFIYLIAVPILTMRSMSEERHQKTDQLLYTSPVSVPKIVLGKYFAMIAVLLIPTVLICVYPLILKSLGATTILAGYASIIAFYFLGCCLIAVGMFISSLTENQVIAAVVTFAVLFISSMMTTLAQRATSSTFITMLVYAVLILILGAITYLMTKNVTIAAIVACVLEIALLVIYFAKPTLLEGTLTYLLKPLDMFSKIDAFASKVFDIGALVYYISVSALFVFFTIQITEKRRWA